MSKFQVGQQVCLFNSIAMKIEKDDVYAILYVPVPKEGVPQDGNKSIKEKLDAGMVEVKEQYQLAGHQGVLDAESLFATEEECKEFFRDFFKK